MSMLKSSIAKAVAAAIALSAGTAAFATPGPNAGGNTDLFVAVWNPSTNASYVQDLGSSYSLSNLDSTSAFSNPNGYSISTTLDGGNLSTAPTGCNSSNSNCSGGIGPAPAAGYSFNLFAGDLTIAGSSFNTFTGNVMYLSQTTTTTITQENNGSVFSSAGQSSGNYVANNLPGAQASVIATDNAAANSKYWASTSNVTAPGCTFTLGGYPGCATGTGKLALVKYVGVSEVSTDNTQANYVGNSKGAGLFSLSGAVLSYNLAPAVTGVPLPAAGWLLVSGLLGLGAVGRRKAAAAAA